MNLKKTLICLGALLLCTAALSAQEIIVTWEEGSVQLKAGAAWKAVAIGDKLVADSTVRVEKDSLLELKAAGSSFTISQPGSYLIKDILASRKKSEANGVMKTLQSSFNQLAGSSGDKRQTAVAGVRAAAAGETPSLPYAEGQLTEMIKQGQQYLAEAKYGEALDEFRKAEAEALQDEKPQIKFLAAFTLAQTGETRQALDELQGVSAANGEEWAADFVLLKARLMIDCFAWKDAVELLGKQSAITRDAKRAPLYYFLLGVAQSSAGDQAASKASLNKVIGLDKNSELAKAAAVLLQN